MASDAREQGPQNGLAAPSEPTPFWQPTNIFPPIVAMVSCLVTDDVPCANTLVEKPLKAGTTLVGPL